MQSLHHTVSTSIIAPYVPQLLHHHKLEMTSNLHHKVIAPKVIE